MKILLLKLYFGIKCLNTELKYRMFRLNHSALTNMETYQFWSEVTFE